jgi:hypothetical protein
MPYNPYWRVYKFALIPLAGTVTELSCGTDYLIHPAILARGIDSVVVTIEVKDKMVVTSGPAYVYDESYTAIAEFTATEYVRVHGIAFAQMNLAPDSKPHFVKIVCVNYFDSGRDLLADDILQYSFDYAGVVEQCVNMTTP